jgi:thiamine pyrophosphokinase
MGDDRTRAVTDAVVLAGGDPVDPRWRPALPHPALVVAADSGLAHARTLGLAVDVVVGDLDSVDPEHLRAAVAAGSRVEQHPADKDATDLELALDAARAAGATRALVLGAGGGRLDHFLANALLLAAPQWSTMQVIALVGEARVTVVRDRAELGGRPGSLLTLLPLAGAAIGVRTTGLRWPLAGDRLEPGSTRGVSNELTAAHATVALESGVLLAIQPHALPDSIPNGDH